MKHLYYTLILAACTVATASAQVGFNNPNPDPSAVVDVKASDKGILIPRMSSGLRQAMAIGNPTPAHGLLVFDTTLNRLYFWDNTQWQPANVVVTDSTGANEIVRVETEMTIGAGYTGNEPPNNGLIIEGNVGIGTNDPGTDKLAVNGNASATGNVLVGGNVEATGDIEGDNITASGTLTGADYAIPTASNTNSPVPSGGIILWSGSTTSIPSGWALCNGVNGTPDLRDRFVIGAGSTYSVDATGGAATHAHTASSVSDHTHTLPSNTGGITTYTPSGSFSSTGYVVEDDNTGWDSDAYLETHTDSNYGEGQHGHLLGGSTGANGGHTHTISTTSHLPPYYALAYIMKL